MKVLQDGRREGELIGNEQLCKHVVKSDSKCLGQHSIFFNVSQKKNHSAWDKLT